MAVLRAPGFPTILLVLSLTGCVRTLALNAAADTLAGTGGVFASDEDPELVREAIPFGLKTYESILADLPEHRGLLLATASGFTQYAYAFVQMDADFLDATDLPRSREMRARAQKLLLRARDYGLRGLEVGHPGFRAGLRKDLAATLAATTRDDVPFLYWTGVAWAAALMSDKKNLDLVADLPTAGALVQRVLELDEAYDGGAAHEFLVSYEGSRPEAMGGSAKRARHHYERALAHSKGKRAGVYVALAESVSAREQNLPEFKRLLAAALEVDPEAAPGNRLLNTLMQRRARWLLTRLPDLFVDVEEDKK